MRKSAPFRVGAIVSSPIPDITSGRSLRPQSYTRWDVIDFCKSTCWRSNHTRTNRQRPVGISAFHISNRIARVLPFRRWPLCQRVRTKQAHIRSRPILGRAFETIKPLQLDDVYW